MLAGCATGTTATTPLTNATITAAAESTTTMASVTSVQPPAGWTKYTGGGAEIYLPPAFDQQLSANTDIPSVLKELQARGMTPEEVANATAVLTTIPDISQVAIFVFDSADVASGRLTDFIMTLPYKSADSLKQFVDSGVDTYSAQPGMQLIDRMDLSLSRLEGTRLTWAYSSVPGPKYTELMYVVKGPSVFWMVNYLTSPAEAVTLFPDLEKSAATFNIVP